MARCLTGSQIGSFRLTGLIGAGATGTVYRGVHVDLGHEVAVKTLRPPQTGVARLRQLSRRFVSEARLLASLAGCPNIVSVYDFGHLPDGQLFYVMELLEGHDLEHVLSRYGPLDVDQLTVYLQQICHGLEHAHRRGVVHRDLKPSNIFVCPAELPRVVLLDFGIAINLRTHTIPTLGVVGSPIYAAPEQISRDLGAVGPWSDIYTLGVLCYQLLAGELPFCIPSDARPHELLMLPLLQTPRPLAAAAGWLQRPLCALVDSCLSRDPRRRPQSARGFFEAYLAALSHQAPDKGHRTALGLPLASLMPTIADEGNPPRRPEVYPDWAAHLGSSPSTWTGSLLPHGRRTSPLGGTTRLSVAAMLCALLLGGPSGAGGPALSGAQLAGGLRPQTVTCSSSQAARAAKAPGQLELVIRTAPTAHCEAIINGLHVAPPPKTVPTRLGFPTTLVLACDGYRLGQHSTTAQSGRWVITPQPRPAEPSQNSP